ncbi:alpha/beta fold hydrolase [Neoroseomonas oryzicola]|uniref:Alpha/beta fold hydrolase n=1 Tax=Neoroseomonas oryzicola TaxID=535904 RepID=A0A9X9WGU7_9PROT|nr:alpha/beta fold hydrolase [Neoroseomonas oryzicola]MBR0659557.1 alpha/beta fold hydrolase [Neoroseomonas oryzicola]NKE16164.1 alpha/beta fold hydrolase [Neoroseomonas oryzicola]
MRLAVTEAGEGPPLLLLHGLFGSGQNWGAIRRALAPRFRVLTPDLRNHGASPRAAEMTYAAMAADIAETMDAAGVGRAAVLGHSMGGKAAMAFALSHPQRVERLVVADIAPIRYKPSLRAYVAAMQALPLGAGLARKEADAALAASIPEAGIRAFLLQNLRFEADPPEWRIGLAEIAAAMPEIEDFAAPPGARYDGPVLVIAGERSPYIRAEHHALFRALFPAARFATVPAAGHWVHAENPAGFLALLEPFLAESA